MRANKRKTVTESGWQVGEASDFLGLTPDEQADIELRLQQAESLNAFRESPPRRSKMPQKQSTVLDPFRNMPDYELADVGMEFTDS